MRHSQRILAILLMSLLTFSACKKDRIATTEPVATGDGQFQVNAELQLENMKMEIARFEDEFRYPEPEAGVSARHSNTIVDIAVKLPFFKSLVAAVVKTGLASTLSSSSLNATVFAPTDAAFARLPHPFNNPSAISAITDQGQIDFLKNVLLYHVLGSEVKKRQVADGRSAAETLKPRGQSNDNTIYLSKQFGIISINGSSVVLLPDVNASNGVIHVINNVLLFPTNTIAEIAVGNPDFSVLVAALQKANLVNVFTGEGDFTVFAPTNAAFAALPAPFNSASNISSISDQGQINALSNILRYHVVGSRYFSIDLGFFKSISTLADAPSNKLTGILGFNTAYVKGRSNSSYSTIRPGNILATNGVVHVIDKVLLP